MTRQPQSADEWAEVRKRLMADPAFAAAYRERYPYADVANAIIELRAENGLTQQELAAAAGTTQSVIARAESGRHPVGTRFLSTLAGALDFEWRPVFERRNRIQSVDAVEAMAPTGNVVPLFGTRPSPPPVTWASEAVTVRTPPQTDVTEALDEIQSRIEHVRDMFEGAPHRVGRAAKATTHADVG